MAIDIIVDDCRKAVKKIKPASFDCVLTSPPYYKQRNYRHPDQIGNEGTVEGYVKQLVDLFEDVARLLKSDGTLWLNLGDKYIKKRLQGIPWRVALGMQDSGWYLRSAVIWRKPNVKPDGARDRPTNEYEHVFLMSVSDKYYYDADAIKEAPADYFRRGGKAVYLADGMNTDGVGSRTLHQMSTNGRNRRNVWDVPTVASEHGEYIEHFAAMPPALARLCLLASCRPNSNVLDIFGGTGTTGIVAMSLGHDATLIEVNKDYALGAYDRIERNNLPLLKTTEVARVEEDAVYESV